MARVRRSREEIDAGMTVNQKKLGMTIDEIKNAASKNREAAKQVQELKKIENRPKKRKKIMSKLSTKEEWDEVDHDYKKIYKYKVKEKIVEKEVPVIKEVRILNGTKDTNTTVQEFLNKELGKCIWEWKELKMDENFRSTDMTSLGKQGWKMTHIMEWRRLKDDWKKKPDSIYFQRPRTKK
ncbi:hypothetical protein H8D85_02010 [bacterium]|nr:hypothetical protein [bacterium]